MSDKEVAVFVDTNVIGYGLRENNIFEYNFFIPSKVYSEIKTWIHAVKENERIKDEKLHNKIKEITSKTTNKTGRQYTIDSLFTISHKGDIKTIENEHWLVDICYMAEVSDKKSCKIQFNSKSKKTLDQIINKNETFLDSLGLQAMAHNGYFCVHDGSLNKGAVKNLTPNIKVENVTDLRQKYSTTLQIKELDNLRQKVSHVNHALEVAELFIEHINDYKNEKVIKFEMFEKEALKYATLTPKYVTKKFFNENKYYVEVLKKIRSQDKTTSSLDRINKLAVKICNYWQDELKNSFGKEKADIISSKISYNPESILYVKDKDLRLENKNIVIRQIKDTLNSLLNFRESIEMEVPNPNDVYIVQDAFEFAKRNSDSYNVVGIYSRDKDVEFLTRLYLALKSNELKGSGVELVHTYNLNKEFQNWKIK
jgi:hypothetical protein